MYKTKQKSVSLSDVSSEKPPLTIEEIDCDRRGYKLTDKTLGTGAYAKVKLAYVSTSKKDRHPWLKADLEKKDDNKVAIKIISKKNAPVEYLEKFMPREIDALNATCRHRNVITLYETFRSETKIYLVMEFAATGDLLGFINAKTRKGTPLSEDKAKLLFRQIVLGIIHCHQRNVVHRDLKCENVLIDMNDVIKITDFGFATRYPTNKCKFLDTFCGSYAYAAPEILSAQKYDGKLADIWSLGVILFAMTCGRLPYNDKSLNYLIEQTKKKVTFPERVNLSSDLRDLVHGILVFDANNRMTLNEILLHPWLAMIKMPNQTNEEVKEVVQENTKSNETFCFSDRLDHKSVPRVTGKSTPERRPRPLGVPRQHQKPKRPQDLSNVQFIVATQENPTRKSAIPAGIWSPKTSMPESCHVEKFLRDKNNNDVMKFLMSSSPDRAPVQVGLRKTPVERHQTKTATKKPLVKSTDAAEPQPCPTPDPRPLTAQHKAVQEGQNKSSGSSMKSGVFLRTVHTLYKCKKVENEIANEKQNVVGTQARTSSHQGFLKTFSLDYDKFNFPPVSSRATPEARQEQQRVASSRLSRMATWRNPLTTVRNNRPHFGSKFGKKYHASGRTSRSSSYEHSGSPLGIKQIADSSVMSQDSRGASPCPQAAKRTRGSAIARQKPLVSKLTVHVVK